MPTTRNSIFHVVSFEMDLNLSFFLSSFLSPFPPCDTLMEADNYSYLDPVTHQGGVTDCRRKGRQLHHPEVKDSDTKSPVLFQNYSTLQLS